MTAATKKLGDYIEVVDLRNKDNSGIPLLGVSIKKELIPSIANTIGTDMTSYKIISKGQFAYGPVTSRNGDKISVALLENHKKALVSQAYTVFRIIDESKLDPRYLMLWFRRPEFDRFARFKSHGSAREIFSWEEMCDTDLYIPDIEIQHQIIERYSSIQKEINTAEILNSFCMELGDRLINRDLATIDEDNKKERTLGEFFPVITGKKDANYGDNGGAYPFYTCAKDPINSPGYSFDSDSLLLAGNGNFDINWCKGKFEAYQRVYVLTPYCQDLLGLLYFLIRCHKNRIIGGAQGSVIQFLTKGMIEDYSLRLPSDDLLQKIAYKYNCILDYISKNKEKIQVLQTMKHIVIANLTNQGES